MKRTSRPPKRVADELFSKVVRARDGSCRRCGTQDRLQCAHVISRRYMATRWDPENAYALCLSCHKWETEHPLEGADFWSELLGEELYAGLRRKALAGVQGRTDFKALHAVLRDRLVGLAVGERP